ncbi:hypothetical protein HPB49_007570 [Dermacentor silvarum]|uniref:Uncharacterized protein n=1 Tax=Dermacentor silvarum TaxID=543639 RepID=A0ACB8C837_DERSI|nr:hypothetical protein HPB49_007570 [Dermacentor silvarum]
MAVNLGMGLYFSRRRKGQSGTVEVFLGSRSLRALPLAVSMVATSIVLTGLVGFTGHYYAYGFHLTWNDLTIVIVAPLVAQPVPPRFVRTAHHSVLRRSDGAKRKWCRIVKHGGWEGAVEIFRAPQALTAEYG